MGIIKKDTQFEGQMRGQKWKGGEQNPELSLQQFLTKEAEGDARNTGTWAERGETVRMTERGETLERGREGTERFPLPFAAEGAHLARDVFAWSGCAITLELTYLAQSLREVSHCGLSWCACVLVVIWVQIEWQAYHGQWRSEPWGLTFHDFNICLWKLYQSGITVGLPLFQYLKCWLIFFINLYQLSQTVWTPPHVSSLFHAASDCRLSPSYLHRDTHLRHPAPPLLLYHFHLYPTFPITHSFLLCQAILEQFKLGGLSGSSRQVRTAARGPYVQVRRLRSGLRQLGGTMTLQYTRLPSNSKQ